MRTLFTGLAVLIATSLTPAFAAAPMYRVTPQAMPSDGQLIVHDVAWRCGSGSCVAPRTGKSTDATVCSALARNFGPLTSFAVGDDAFDSGAIERCNRRAR